MDPKTECSDTHKRVDICIPESNIYIEIDGLQHYTDPKQIISDFERDYYSERDGFHTKRISNQLIETHVVDIAEALFNVAEKLKMKPKRIILASQSAGRKEAMKALEIPFEIIPSDYEEDMTLPLSAQELALVLSKGKALSIATKYPDAVVVAADTFVVFEGKYLGKPKNADDAIATLNKLTGNTHVIVTGLTVQEGTKIVSKSVSTNVVMKKVSEKEIRDYVATGEPLTKAGSYALQGKGKPFVEKIEGSYWNVIGLPLEALVEILNNNFGMNVTIKP